MAAASYIKIESGHAAPTAAENELITPGGEVMFVCKMIQESLSSRQGSL
jgi:methyltransferase